MVGNQSPPLQAPFASRHCIKNKKSCQQQLMLKGCVRVESFVVCQLWEKDLSFLAGVPPACKNQFSAIKITLFGLPAE